MKLVPNNGNYLTELAIIYQKEGDHVAAVDLFNKIIEKQPNNDNALFMRGNSVKKLGDKKGALRDYNLAIRFNHEVPEFFTTRGFLLTEMGDYDTAIDDFSKVIALAPKDNQENRLAIAFNNRGHVRYKQGQYGKALGDINYSLQLFEDNAYAYRNRALVNIGQKIMQSACDDIEKGLALGYTKKYGDELESLKKQHCK